MPPHNFLLRLNNMQSTERKLEAAKEIKVKDTRETKGSVAKSSLY